MPCCSGKATTTSDPQTQTPEQREQELRAAGWIYGWVDVKTRRCRPVWAHPNRRRFYKTDEAWLAMRAERGER